MEIPNSFCVLPWIHIHPYPNGNVAPCCAWLLSNPVSHISQGSLTNIAMSPNFNNIRRQMLNGIIPEGCHQCAIKDEADAKSFVLKEVSNKSFASLIPDCINNTNEDGSLKVPFKMRYMNIRYSNLCNNACRTCGSSHSSMIAQENLDTSPIKRLTDLIPDYTQEIFSHLDHVEMINFAGGESLIIPEHWEVLDKLIELGKTNVKIKYVTNLSKLSHGDKNLIDYIKEFPEFKLVGSIDALFERAEYYRFGSKWSTIEDNLKTIRKHNINFMVNCTVGATNIWHVPDVHRYLLENNYIDCNKLILIIVASPIHNIRILPKWYKQEITEKINLHIDWLKSKQHETSAWVQLLSFMHSEDNSIMLSEFFNYNKQLDFIREQNLFKVFPELERVYNTCDWLPS